MTAYYRNKTKEYPSNIPNGLFQEKIHTPPADGFLEILSGGGSKAMEIQAGGGVEHKKVFFGDHFQTNVTLNI